VDDSGSNTGVMSASSNHRNVDRPVSESDRTRASTGNRCDWLELVLNEYLSNSIH
jgi:hypothetical protein